MHFVRIPRGLNVKLVKFLPVSLISALVIVGLTGQPMELLGMPAATAPPPLMQLADLPKNPQDNDRGEEQAEQSDSIEQEVAKQKVAKQEVVDFNQDIRPIFSDTCFKCHGPDEANREAGLRLDQPESVFDDLESVVPGDLESSELYLRLITDDEWSKMPPPESGRVLTPRQIQLIRDWIEQGAAWEEHWSLVPPRQPELPTVENPSWISNPIDRFVLARLERSGLQPNAPADRADLIRRVSLDLTGLPPTPEAVEAFVHDTHPQAYERLVERLCATPHFGEHQARYWLDAARYGDTHGLHLDNYREMWLYRDWVINAFNQNMPYDQFLVEQLAGDLLEDPTDSQLIATGFNRAHVTTNEGGSIKEEVLVRNVVDRVATTGTVFLGLTVGCAQCHDHKYDPITQKEFYQLFAFFNSLDGDPMDGNAKDPAPILAQPSQQQKDELAELDRKMASARQEIQARLKTVDYSEPEATGQAAAEPVEYVWIDDQLPAGAKPQQPWDFVATEFGSEGFGELSLKGQAGGFRQDVFTSANPPLRVGADDLLFAHVYLDPDDPPQEIMLQWNDGSWDHRVYWGENIIDFGAANTPSRVDRGELPPAGEWVRLEVPVDQVNLKPGTLINGWAFSQVGGTVYWDRAGILSATVQGDYLSFQRWLDDQITNKGNGLPDPLKSLVSDEEKIDALKRTDSPHRRQLLDHFLQNVYPQTREQFAPMQTRLSQLQERKKQIQSKIPTTLIYREMAEPRQAYLLRRGEYDKRGAEVDRDVPAALPDFPEDLPRNRLGLAQWLVDPQHPLTARVHVNRIWQQFFGTGLVETADDFGAQGTPPSHPGLLDYLAVEFVESGWDTRHMIKQIVLSSTYRQSSRMTAKKLKADPRNRLLSRGPRFRLDAETLRDQALAVSGLLVDQVGGPSVKPPQPDGLWFVVGYSGSNTVRFKKDDGPENVHRRSLYTFWKRTAPPPQMQILDAPSRESCVVRRERTNTPLQALMLMNDPQYVEAARYLAQRIIDHSNSTDARIRWLFQLGLSRPPTQSETSIFKQQLDFNLNKFRANPEQANRLIAIGEIPADTGHYDAAELAAWTMIGNLLMNMDEFVCKP